MDDGRGVVIGIHPAHGIGDHAQAEITVHITPADAFIDGGFKVTVHNVAILADLGENHRHTGILADGNFLFGGQGGVVQHLIEDLTAQGGFLLLLALFEKLDHIIRQAAVGRDAGFLHLFCDQLGRNLTHNSQSSFPAGIAGFYMTKYDKTSYGQQGSLMVR